MDAAIIEAPLRDGVTSLPGIDSARRRLGEWSQGAGLHALLLGLRRFDAVNLAHGAAAGDLALAEVAMRITHFAGAELDGPWLAAHAGGGTFLLVASETCSRERWQVFAEALADVVARPIAGHRGALRLSPRIALLRGVPNEQADQIIDRLSQALAIAQRQQGRRLVWADGELSPPGRTAAELEGDLLGAIDGDQIEILYQPQFSAVDDRITGAEALARWNHPTLGRIGAGALFAIAERTDHIAPLSRHIAQLALADAAAWPGHLRLSLNVTAADLAATSFADELGATTAVSRFPPERLTLEVTEQALLGDIQQARRSLAKLAATGVKVALDDFGAGFCNFRYLKLLPLDYLKLDRSMIEEITTDQRDLAVLRAIVAMARALDLEVIAEGIESDDQRALVAAEGCTTYQGFLRAQPMSAAQFLQLIEA